ncbi:hypothetical protein HNY73_010636 [Argiope bruennichi]|uniref:Uncharacterized protein n=1 Tax=Argiope bruennichi TaxID=94029 RepID=A0A8T0F6J5_ARGBR|nr:hypothetical protein HNY73_010636 [Argiope bruennichi]
MVPESKAAIVIENLLLTTTNYQKAVELLKERFEHEYLLVQVYVRELLCMVTNNVTSERATTNLKALYDELVGKLQALERIQQKYRDFLIPLRFADTRDTGVKKAADTSINPHSVSHVPQHRAEIPCVSDASVRIDGKIWHCRKKGLNPQHIKRSVRKGSCFDKSHWDLGIILCLTYMWLNQMRRESIVNDLNVSARTVTDWMNFCRGLCEDTCLAFDGKMGGVGKIVKIDESKFGKKKYNRGKRVEGRWVFGGIAPEKNAYSGTSDGASSGDEAGMIGSAESSPALSINSSLERLNLLQISDDEIGTHADDIYADTTEVPLTPILTQVFPNPSESNYDALPSISSLPSNEPPASTPVGTPLTRAQKMKRKAPAIVARKIKR